MELKGKKLELDLEELMPLLIANKQEAFRHIGEKLLNSVLEKEFESFIVSRRLVHKNEIIYAFFVHFFELCVQLPDPFWGVVNR